MSIQLLIKILLKLPRNFVKKRFRVDFGEIEDLSEKI